MEFVTRYGQKRKVVVKFSKEEKRTKDSFKDECDINQIMKKYLRTGQLPNLIQKDPSYGDFSNIQSYQESLNLVMRAQESFQSLPAKVRAECGNDPAVFLELVNDPTWVERHKDALKGTQVLENALQTKSEGLLGSGDGRSPGKDSSSKEAKESTKG